MSNSTPYTRDLGGGLTLRDLASPADVERVAAFNAQIHGPETEQTWATWMRSHPYASDPRRWLFVEEAAGGRVVAALCQLPWRLQYDGVPLRSGEMGVVGTLEEYRGRGLQRALAARFDELLREGGFLLSHIQGIPFFYRQFGYEYALPLEAWVRVELYLVPELRADEGPGATVRLATLDDLPALMRLYDHAGTTLGVGALRDEAEWQFLMGKGLETEVGAETWVVEAPPGLIAGYFRTWFQGFGEGLICGESSLLSADGAMAALRHLKRLAEARDKPYIRLNLPRDSALVRIGLALGGSPWEAYAWQVRIPDPAALLRAIAPALEGRLAASPYAGLTRAFTINLYRRGITLRFEAGRLTAVEEGAGGGGDLRLPPQLLAPLLLGHRSLEELHHLFPDASAGREAAPLVATLFPRFESFLYQPY
jgi:GNAT superfamily N-acetyltransferase